MTSPTAPIWTDDAFFDSNEYAVTVRILGSGTIDYGFSLLTANGFQRCWIPAEVRLLSFVPSLGLWSVGGLGLGLAIAGIAAVRRSGSRAGRRDRTGSTRPVGWPIASS